MASINGIQIKNRKNFRDHEGMTISQGSIWYNGKRLGNWSQSYNGAVCDDFDFNESILNDEVEKYKKSNYVSEKYKDITSIETLLSDLLHLMDSEKAFKSCIKKGYHTYVEASDGFHISGYYTMDTDKDVILNSDFHKNFITDCENEFFKDWNKSISIFSSLDDFKIVA